MSLDLYVSSIRARADFTNAFPSTAARGIGRWNILKRELTKHATVGNHALVTSIHARIYDMYKSEDTLWNQHVKTLRRMGAVFARYRAKKIAYEHLPHVCNCLRIIQLILRGVL